MDHAGPYIEAFLSFLGITVEQIYVAPGTAGEAKEQSIAKAKQAIAANFSD